MTYTTISSPQDLKKLKYLSNFNTQRDQEKIDNKLSNRLRRVGQEKALAPTTEQIQKAAEAQAIEQQKTREVIAAAPANQAIAYAIENLPGIDPAIVKQVGAMLNSTNPQLN